MPGRHAYNLPDAADQWVSRTASPEEVAFSKLDSTATLNVVKRAMASEEEKQLVEDYQTDYKVFLKMYPAYIDNQHNAQLMKHHWESVFGVSVPSLPQMEETWFSLRNSGVLQLNAAAVAKEDAAEIAQRADAVIAQRKAAEFDEDAANSMSMEELEAKCRGW